MSNPSGAKWTAVAAVGVLIAVAAILALVRERGVVRTGSATAAGSGSDGASAVSGAEHALEGAATVASRAAEPATTADATLGRGALRLAFVGDPDGAPVSDLPFVVRQERGQSKDLARGVSDTKGRAEVRDLEENVILVETPRHPPYAKKIAACWLKKGESKDLVVHLDGGARVSGRVVDDLGRPVEDAEILTDSDLGIGFARKSPLEGGTIAARSGTDGRFAVDHVADTPSGIWIVDGESRPERWLSATLTVRKDLALNFASSDVKPGSAIDIGDVVLVRTSTVAGVVLDSEGRPVAGALVSTRGDRFVAREFDARATASIAEELRPERGEGSTGPDGKFELRLGRDRSILAVWTPWGQRQIFPLPAIAPGDRNDDFVLRLEAVHLLTLELLDERGQRILGPGPAARERGVMVFSRKNFVASNVQAECVLELEDGTGERNRAVAGSDGLFHLQWKSSLARVRAFTVRMAGYETFHERSTNGLVREVPLTCTLKETPPLRFRLRRSSSSAPQRDGSATNPVQVWAQVCLATPEQRRGPRPDTWRCCGLGAAIQLQWNGEEKSFTLPAAGGRSFWLYFVGFDRGFADLASFGPFDAGEEVHEIAIDPESLRSGLDANAAAKTPPDPKVPGDGEKRGKLSFRLVDSRTGEPLRGQAKGEPMDAEAKKASFPFVNVDASGRAAAKSFPTGSWTITFGGDGHRDSQRTGVAVRAYEETDLGAITLDPMPGFRGRVVDADEEPATEGTWIQVRGRGGDHQVLESGLTDEEGRFVVKTDVPIDAWLEVYEASASQDSAGRAGQRLSTSGWSADEERVFKLAPWQRVEVRVTGAVVDPPGSQLAVSACPAPGEPNATCDHRAGVPPGHGAMLIGNEVMSDPSQRVYRFRMAPGRYQVFGTGLLHEVPVQIIDVKDSGDVQAFDLDSK